jgi:hypothetical protein
MKQAAQRLTGVLAAGLLLAGCAGAGSNAASSDGYATVPPEQLVRRLATVYASPTPDADAVRQTQVAIRPTADLRMPTAQPSPTVYIGIFLGAEDAGGGLPVIDPARYQGTLAAAVPPLDATQAAGACAIPVDPVFGASWTSNAEAVTGIRCPIEAAQAYIGTAQIFERGAMYFVPSGAIWSIAISGTGGPYWFVPQAPPDTPSEIPAPDGLRLPQLGFGAVWRGVAGVREALGFARTDETAASLTVQRFENGTLILDSSAGQVFVLVGPADSGTAFGPY